MCSKSLLAEKDLFPDLCTRRELLDQKIKCQYSQFGCSIELCPIDMEKHINECQYKKSDSTVDKFDCDFKHVGCSDVFSDEESRRKHVEENVNIHLMVSTNNLIKLKDFLKIC